MGGAGFSGISANFYPWLHARLCSVDATEDDKAKIQRFLSVAEVGSQRSLLQQQPTAHNGFRSLSVTAIQNQRRRKAAPAPARV